LEEAAPSLEEGNQLVVYAAPPMMQQAMPSAPPPDQAEQSTLSNILSAATGAVVETAHTLQNTVNDPNFS